MMPEYTYTDGLHTTTMTHAMLYEGAVHCSVCGDVMWRKPQVVAVNWGGLPPSAGELSQDVKSHIANVDRARDDLAAEHEAHEKRTGGEE